MRLSTSLVAMGLGLATCGMAEAGNGPGRSGASGSIRSFNVGSSSSSFRSANSSTRNLNLSSQTFSNRISTTKLNTSKFNTSKLNVSNISKSQKFANYNLKFGTKFSKGTYYKGKYHDHWSWCCWNSCYGCYLYYDPCCCCWYYWCPVAFCYYPVCYCPYGTYFWSDDVVATVDGPVEVATAEAGPQADSEQTPPQPPQPVNGKDAGAVTPKGQPNVTANTPVGASTTPTIKQVDATYGK